MHFPSLSMCSNIERISHVCIQYILLVYAIINYPSMLLLFYVLDRTRLIIHSIHGFAAIVNKQTTKTATLTTLSQQVPSIFNKIYTQRF